MVVRAAFVLTHRRGPLLSLPILNQAVWFVKTFTN